MISVKKAEKLIKLAREAISDYFKGLETSVSKTLQNEFKEDIGVFVSLYDDGELTGCMGFPDPTMPLWEAVVKAALGAAFEDSRFPPLMEDQFDKVVIELTILGEPEIIEVSDPSEYPSKIEIGKDGLLIRDEFGSGLLPPKTAVEWGWDPKEFLNQTCMKAGLSPDCWDNMKRNVYKFQAKVFVEEKGKLVEKKLY